MDEEDRIKEAYEEWKKGVSLRKLEKKHAISRSTLSRRFEELEKASAITSATLTGHIDEGLKLQQVPPSDKVMKDEGELYAQGFNIVDELVQKRLKPGSIAIELVKRLKLIPDKAKEIVEKYHEQKDLNIVEIMDRIEEMDTNLWLLTQRFDTAVMHGVYKRDHCVHYRSSLGICKNWRWEGRPEEIADDMTHDGEFWRLKLRNRPEYCATCSSYERIRPPF